MYKPHNTKMKQQTDHALIPFQRCFLIGSITLMVCIIIISMIYANHCTNVATEAIKAGLVQQKTSNGSIWVKPEDYKPYPLSPFDAPHWNK